MSRLACCEFIGKDLLRGPPSCYKVLLVLLSSMKPKVRIFQRQLFRSNSFPGCILIANAELDAGDILSLFEISALLKMPIKDFQFMPEKTTRTFRI